ncbi:hypothetical protein ABPG72_020312 [Tetrahymena utriculariae]
MSHLLAAANLDNAFPHSPQFKPTESPLNDIMELSLPESIVSEESNNANDSEKNENQQNSQPKRRLTIYEFLDSKRSNSF